MLVIVLVSDYTIEMLLMRIFAFESCNLSYGGKVGLNIHMIVKCIDLYYLTIYNVLNIVQMTTAISIEDARREVKILRALTGHKNLVQFYDAYEDEDNVYVVME